MPAVPSPPGNFEGRGKTGSIMFDPDNPSKSFPQGGSSNYGENEYFWSAGLKTYGRYNNFSIPSQILLITGSVNGSFQVGTNGVETKFTYDPVGYYHSNGADVLFLDGHVEWWKKPLPAARDLPWPNVPTPWTEKR
jgi:prepilin-type processing-associated H-X9-DG protein